MVHAEVLRASGDSVGAEGATRVALELYERKGNCIAVDRQRAVLDTTQIDN
jgi:hypothetical protein